LASARLRGLFHSLTTESAVAFVAEFGRGAGCARGHNSETSEESEDGGFGGGHDRL
jgi:hypothetical protein